MTMIKLALLGKDIAHSKSKIVYEKILKKQINYTLLDFKFESQIPPLDKLFLNIDGLSITSPYKQVFVNNIKLSFEASLVKAINCIKYDAEKNIYHGFNTDYLACVDLFKKYNISQFEEIIVLGNGPMARIILSILSEEKIEALHVFRSAKFKLNELNLNNLNSSNICVINCCSRGVVFEPKGNLNKIKFFWDLNYGQDELYHKLGLRDYKNGVDLLEQQAKFALNIWGLN